MRCINCNGRLFYQCQESAGPDFADNGYSLIYADLVNHYVEMTVGEDTAYYVEIVLPVPGIVWDGIR
ncbi:hypothetical protein Bca4012_008888 [Brassica carinata]|uniref:Uncharacterized protein n=1 Tax=Brassica carinata TaxID=52824 RepID=A0A8X7V5Z8_BRACI|nr:hypothetical protein Bca52824_037423 [Brassica carinata]